MLMYIGSVILDCNILRPGRKFGLRIIVSLMPSRHIVRFGSVA